MKKTIHFLSIVLIITFIFSACTKKADENDANKFIGTWNGSTTCTGGGTGGTSATFGGSGKTLTMAGTVGSGSCQKSITATGTASGNAFTFPSQSFTDNCGVTATISMTGSLSGSTITVITTGSVAGVSATCTFTGTK